MHMHVPTPHAACQFQLCLQAWIYPRVQGGIRARTAANTWASRDLQSRNARVQQWSAVVLAHPRAFPCAAHSRTHMQHAGLDCGTPPADGVGRGFVPLEEPAGCGMPRGRAGQGEPAAGSQLFCISMGSPSSQPPPWGRSYSELITALPALLLGAGEGGKAAARMFPVSG